MIQEIRSSKTGFTIIEMMVVILIVAFLAAASMTTYILTMERLKLQSDTRGVYEALQLARIRALSTGKPHGVAFWRRDGNNQGDSPDAYFVFVDCNEDYYYTDSNADPYDNEVIDNWNRCNAGLGFDPRIEPGMGGSINALTGGNYFTIIIDTKEASADPGTFESIMFNNLGQAVRGSFTGIREGFLYIQNHHYRQTAVDRLGVEIIGASGQMHLAGMSVVGEDDWGPP